MPIYPGGGNGQGRKPKKRRLPVDPLSAAAFRDWMDQRKLTFRDAAVLLGVSLTTVSSWRKNGTSVLGAWACRGVSAMG
jgi:hypothetical protein